MNADPVRLAAGLALIAVCALANESPNVKMAEPQTVPATTREIPPYAVGLNDQPMQLPTQAVDMDGLRNHMKQVNEELQEAFQRQALTTPHTLYEKALTKNTAVDLLSLLLVAQQVTDPRMDAIVGGHDQTVLPAEDGRNQPMPPPILRSSW